MSQSELNELQISKQSEQELRKHLYQAISKQKKSKGNDDGTMDAGTLLFDSTMEYVPTLSENSTDAEIEGLEKHDAILELADFIKKCGKRVNFYTLNASTVEELHTNIKIARDDHKRVKQVFPELSGIDARWFGPKSERTDQDYEPSEAGDDALDDVWADLSDDEITDLKTDIAVCDDNDGASKKKSKVDLEEEHQKLLQELYTQVENKTEPEIHTPVDDSQWSKEKLSEEILKVGRKIGKTHYYSVLMHSSKEYLRKQLHSLLVMQKEKSSKQKETILSKQNKNEKKSKKENKKDKKDTKVEKENKNVCDNKKSDVEAGSDGEFEWNEEEAVKGTTEAPKGDNSGKLTNEHSDETTNVTQQNLTDKGQFQKVEKPKEPSISKQELANGTIVFNKDTKDEDLLQFNRFDLITIMSKHVGKHGDVKEEYLVDADKTQLVALCKDLRGKLGLSDIVVEKEDTKVTRFRIIRWKKRQLELKNTSVTQTNNLPGSFDPSFTLPSPSDEAIQDQGGGNTVGNATLTQESNHKLYENTASAKDQGFKQHNTYASVDREEKLHNEEGMTFEPSVDHDGVDISKFTPKSINDNNLNEPPSDKQSHGNKVVAITQKVFNIRVAYGLQKRGQHTPTDIKNFVNLLRQIDPQLSVLPFAEDKNASVNDADVITDETQLPSNQMELSKWAASIEISHNNKLHFGIRVSSILTFSELRRQLYDWCSKTKSFVKFDNIFSRKIFGAGWLLGIHPMYHNRNTLKAVLCRDNPQLLEKISIYPRKVWLDSSENNKKTKTNGIVIDGCFSQKDEIISHLCSYKWSGQYAGVTFVPFKVNEALTEKHQQKAMQEQNLYLRDTWSKVLQVKESICPLECTKSKKTYTFIQWLKLCEIHGRRLLKGVEYINEEKIRIIYHRKNEYDVCQMLTYLFPAIEDQFGKVIAEKLLGDKEKQMKHIKSKTVEQTYSTTCAKYIMQRSNPQDDTVNQPPKIRFNSNFGATTKVVKNKSDSKVVKSYREVAGGKVKINDPEIQAAITALQEAQQAQSKTIVELNEQLREANEKIKNERSENENMQENNNDDEDVDNEMRNEIKALWESQETMKRDLNESMNEKISNSKEEILKVVEENKSSISLEIESLRNEQATATKKIQEQQSVNTFNVLTAIEKLNNRFNELSGPQCVSESATTLNPPISPVEQGSRHGGCQ